MKKHFLYSLLLTAAVIGMPECIRATDTTNFADGIAEAKKETRDILVYFNGSNWCVPAAAFKNAVLDAPAVRKALGESFVFTEIDRVSNPTPAAIEADKKQNKELKISPRNYPAIVLADAVGRAYAQIDCRTEADSVMHASGSFPEKMFGSQAKAAAQKFLNRIAGAQKRKIVRDVAFAEAEKLSGTDKALALGRGLDALDPEVAGTDKATIDAIKKADPEDKSGYVAKYTYHPGTFLEKEVLKPVSEKKPEEAERALQKMLANDKLTLDQRMNVLAAKVAFFKAEKRQPEMIAALKEMIVAAPAHDLAKGAQGYLDFLEKPVILAGGKWANSSCRNPGVWVINATGAVTAPGRYEVVMQHESGGDWQRVSKVSLVSGDEVLATKTTNERVGPGNKRLAWQFDLEKIPAGGKVDVKLDVKCEGWWWSSEGVVSVKKI